MKNITIYTGPMCSYCDAAKRLLTRNNATYNEIDIRKVDGAMDEMIKKANGKRTIPQIFFNEEHIGGYDEVRALEKENKLTRSLKIKQSKLLKKSKYIQKNF
jgi:glutaredoxin 3